MQYIHKQRGGEPGSISNIPFPSGVLWYDAILWERGRSDAGVPDQGGRGGKPCVHGEQGQNGWSCHSGGSELGRVLYMYVIGRGSWV